MWCRANLVDKAKQSRIFKLFFGNIFASVVPKKAVELLFLYVLQQK